MGFSSKDFVPALGEFLGSSAGLSASVITKLTETWQGEARPFAARPLADRDFGGGVEQAQADPVCGDLPRGALPPDVGS